MARWQSLALPGDPTTKPQIAVLPPVFLDESLTQMSGHGTGKGHDAAPEPFATWGRTPAVRQ
ncbi:MAG: hypothetical protein GW911_11025 [Armatimonadetes bacterium]|nr:hypothetical protein [Armatimonadota bacterium]NCO92906.1 hypothetical protein [Armatimonadota bacterium]NCP29028.1 hypothetical protein [Armatimonadota bacterium]NDK12565.1 hypothetical protein [Armatimonadota bacterium]